MADQDNMRDPSYLGDGVYAGHDGYQIWLSVGDHQHPTIALEPSVLAQLIEYYHRIFNKDGTR